MLKSSSSGCCVLTQLKASIPILIKKKREKGRKKERRRCLIGKLLHLPVLLRFLSLCVAVFSGTCTVQLPREETHVSTRVRPKLSMTTWVYTHWCLLEPLHGSAELRLPGCGLEEDFSSELSRYFNTFVYQTVFFDDLVWWEPYRQIISKGLQCNEHWILQQSRRHVTK